MSIALEGSILMKADPVGYDNFFQIKGNCIMLIIDSQSLLFFLWLAYLLGRHKKKK